MSEWMKKSIEHDKAHYESMIHMTEKKVLGLVEVIKTQCEAVQVYQINDAAIAGFAVQLQAAAGELRVYRELFRQATTCSRWLDEIALEEDGTPLRTS